MPESSLWDEIDTADWDRPSKVIYGHRVASHINDCVQRYGKHSVLDRMILTAPGSERQRALIEQFLASNEGGDLLEAGRDDLADVYMICEALTRMSGRQRARLAVSYGYMPWWENALWPLTEDGH